MQCGTPLCVFKPLLVVAALAAVGMGGYNLATTGCPLGTCDKPDQSTTLTAANDVRAAESSRGSCAGEVGTEQAILASVTTDSAAAAGCTDAMRAACETMGECPEGMMAHCQSAGECPMAGAKAAQVAGHCEGMEPADCQRGCDMPVAPEQTADAEQPQTEDQVDSGEG